ncbi:hypothetical protein FB45DRAFT_190311 [Roridomyces roridus]|uniref:GRF-type domain-containing protein n=1 Tax=Roridomyces roridus TaxID=1738132 RepID=A0AAD7CEV6_9AGAR|nr:hypothetical protein FB45DRAFT_190311 [Roridomyces roridus]
MSNLHLASPVRSNGKVRCFRHENLLERQVSKTLANPNRGFYSCDASVGTDGESCDFFKWEDEMSPPPSPSPSRKRPASLLEDDLAHKRPNTSQNTTRSPASQARYEAIMRSSRQGTSVTPSPSPANTSTAGPSTAVHRPVTPTPKTEEQDWYPTYSSAVSPTIHHHSNLAEGLRFFTKTL